MFDIRFCLFVCAVCAWLCCGAKGGTVVDDEATNAEWAMADEAVGDNAESDSLAAAAIIAAARTFTPEELNSAMMTDRIRLNDKGNDRFSLTDWCFDHLFLSGLLALLLAYGGTWVVYRICRYFFITLKNP
ncbi:MAG: hypothetical protein IJT30_12050 [Muribaculaceae bacterium]|nr:hypothetical protein [Muribaculaceae bacterium]